MPRINKISCRIGDMVCVEGKIVAMEKDLIGQIVSINSHHMTIEDHNHIRYSIHFSDYKYIKCKRLNFSR